MAESGRAVAAAFLGNAALAVTKGAVAMSTGSAALLAETLHSVADTGNQALLFLGMQRAKRPPDRTHPFGYGKDVYFWAFIVAVMLFCVGGTFSIWEAIWKIRHATDHQATGLAAYGVIGASFVFESMSLSVALRSLARVRGERTLLQYWRESRDPTLRTVLLEDTAALVSLTAACAGIWLSNQTQSPLWDALASGLIGTVLIGVALLLACENYSLLIGRAAPASLERQIRGAVLCDPDVVDLVDLRTMHVGPSDVLISIGVRFRPELHTEQIEGAVRRVERAIERALPDRTDRNLISVEASQSGGQPDAGAAPQRARP